MPSCLTLCLFVFLSVCLMAVTGKNKEIHNMEFAIESLNSISILFPYYIHSMEIAISMKIGFPYYFPLRSIQFPY